MWRTIRSAGLLVGVLALFTGGAKAKLMTSVSCYDPETDTSSYYETITWTETRAVNSCAFATAEASYGHLLAIPFDDGEYGNASADFYQTAIFLGLGGEASIQFRILESPLAYFTVDGTWYPHLDYAYEPPLLPIYSRVPIDLHGHAATEYWHGSSLRVVEMRVYQRDDNFGELRLLATFEGLKQTGLAYYDVVPEPSAFLLIGTGAAVLLFSRLRSRAPRLQ